MNIGGVLVHCKTPFIEEASNQLNLMPGVEVHAANEDGRLVVTIELETPGQLADTLGAMHDIKGVLSAAVIYHHAEDDSDTEEHHEFPVEAPSCGCSETETPEAQQ